AVMATRSSGSLPSPKAFCMASDMMRIKIVGMTNSTARPWASRDNSFSSLMASAYIMNHHPLSIGAYLHCHRSLRARSGGWQIQASTQYLTGQSQEQRLEIRRLLQQSRQLV